MDPPWVTTCHGRRAALPRARQAGTHIPVAPADWSPGAAYRCNGILEYKKNPPPTRSVPGPWHPRCICPRGQTCRAPAGVARAPHCTAGNCCGFLGQGGGGGKARCLRIVCVRVGRGAGEAWAGESTLRAGALPCGHGGVGRFADEAPPPRDPTRDGLATAAAALGGWSRHARWTLAGGRRGRTRTSRVRGGLQLLTFARRRTPSSAGIWGPCTAARRRVPHPTIHTPCSRTATAAAAVGVRRWRAPPPCALPLVPPLLPCPRPFRPFLFPPPPPFFPSVPPHPRPPFMSSPIPVLAPTVSASASSAAAAAVGVAALAASSSHAARPQFRRAGGHPGRAPSSPGRRPPGGGVGLPGLPPAAAAQLAAFAAALGGLFPPVVAAAKGFGASRRPRGGGAAAAGGGFGSPAGSPRAEAPRASKGSGGKLRPCEPCGGTGLKRCAFCRGGGVMIGYLGASVPCVPCEQKGTMGRPCPDCGGMGFFQ